MKCSCPHSLPKDFRLQLRPEMCNIGGVGDLEVTKTIQPSKQMGMGQNPVPLVNPKIAGKWMFIPLKMYL